MVGFTESTRRRLDVTRVLDEKFQGGKKAVLFVSVPRRRVETYARQSLGALVLRTVDSRTVYFKHESYGTD